MDYSSHASSELTSRVAKAAKIARLLELDQNDKHLNILEVGAGSGWIAHYFATKYADSVKVFAVDVTDQRVQNETFDFLLYDGKVLPYKEGCFDVVISNHVIEHIIGRERQRLHLKELVRVLKEGGRLYLATPSRWQLIEPHFRLMFLSWLPSEFLRSCYVRLLRKGDKYDCDPMSPSELESMLQDFHVKSENINSKALIDLCNHELSGKLTSKIVAILPTCALSKFRRLSPTMIYLINKCD